MTLLFEHRKQVKRERTWFGTIQYDSVLLRMDTVYTILNTESSNSDHCTKRCWWCSLPEGRVSFLRIFSHSIFNIGFIKELTI
jgi:hypothetical protein